MTQYTLPLDSPSSNLATTGGKGHNLAILSRAAAAAAAAASPSATDTDIDGNDGTISNSNFLVPYGFTVTVDAYHAFLAENDGLLHEIETALSPLNQDDGNNDDEEENQPHRSTTSTADLEQMSKTIRDAFRRRQLSKPLQAEVKARLDDLLPDPSTTFAVRSSATCEDMPDASFAGQHDTYLNVARADVCRHIVDCFGSLFTSRAISYRERNSIPHTDNTTTGMAVVVQALVPSLVCSGVLFTANPLTGRRTESVLEAIPGLGEALVSGLTEPDRYVVARDSVESEGAGSSSLVVKIKDAKVGAKLTAIRAVEGGGTTEETKEVRDSNDMVLTDTEVKRLVLLGQKIEALFSGTPQDIEWARSADGTTYIVQSRPITTLFPLPKDVPINPLQVFFSFGAIQGISAPFYPQGFDALRNLLGGLINFITGGRCSAEGRFITAAAQRVYANTTPVVTNSIGRRMFRKLLTVAEPGILAGLDELQDELPITSGMSPFFFLRLASILSVVVPRYVYAMMRPDHAREDVIKLFKDKVAAVERESCEAKTLLQVVAFKRKTLKEFLPSILFRFAPCVVAGLSPLRLLNHLASSLEGGKDLVLTITRGLPHNVTTEMDLQLFEVAKHIRADTKTLAYFQEKDAEVLAQDYLDNKMSVSSAAQDAIRSFFSKYGCRGLWEIDFGRPRWREEPTPIMQTLKSYIEIPAEHAPDVVFARGEKAAEEAIDRLGRNLGKPWLVSFLAKRVRALAGQREAHKFGIVNCMGIVREKYLEQGRKLVEEGVLDSARDVFLLIDTEMEALALDKSKNWRGLVATRKAVMESEASRAVIPRLIASDGFIFCGGARKTTDDQEQGTLVGEPVSPGSYEGVVRVVHDPAKSELRPGEVLVCHGTDPSWTPLFLSARALVMEVGGLMTHGSVVAREYGIPAVVGIEKVTERLKTGRRIQVDGSSGVVSILDDEVVEEGG